MSTSTIHPTAIVSPGAEIGADCQIGPYCVIGGHVRLGSRCLLHSHVVLDGHTTIGDECDIYPFACIGKRSQDLKYKGEVSFVNIGRRTVLREYVTVHLATAGGNTTKVGDDCLIQAYCHVAHECVVGNGVIMSSGAKLSGHVQLGDYAIIGGHSGVVQFIRIGTMTMIGGFAKVSHDVLPFIIADGIPAVPRAVNKIGMTRRGKSSAAVKVVEDAFRVIFRSNLTTEEATKRLREQYPDDADVAHILEFIGQCTKGLARPGRES